MQREKNISKFSIIVSVIVILVLLFTFIIAILAGKNEKIANVNEEKYSNNKIVTSDNLEMKTKEDKQNIQESERKVINSVFSWNVKNIDLEELENLKNKLELNTIYVQLPSSLETSTHMKELVSFCKEKDIDIYILDGDSDWYQEEKRETVKKIIDRVSEYNENIGGYIKGINLDIEFYTSVIYKSLRTDEEKIEEFQKFYEANKEFCNYAKEKNLNYSIDLPVWLDSLDESILEKIVCIDYDHIAYMNYNKESALNNLDEEVELAEKYNKKMVNIIELQNPEKHEGLSEKETFYVEGLTSGINKMKEILNKYNYDKLGSSYHEYNSLVELIKNNK